MSKLSEAVLDADAAAAIVYAAKIDKVFTAHNIGPSTVLTVLTMIMVKRLHDHQAEGIDVDAVLELFVEHVKSGLKNEEAFNILANLA